MTLRLARNWAVNDRKPKPYPMPILNPNRCVAGQVFAEPGDKHVKATTHEIIIISPDRLKEVFSADDLPDVRQQIDQHIGCFQYDTLNGSNAYREQIGK